MNFINAFNHVNFKQMNRDVLNIDSYPNAMKLRIITARVIKKLTRSRSGRGANR